MKEILCFVGGVVFAGIMGALCFFSCFLSLKSDEYWDELKQDMEKKDERR